MTTSLKPRPKYNKQRTITKKTMTEQPKRTVPVSLTVKSHLPDITLISRLALWEDMKNRMRINNYEVKAAFDDLKAVVKATQTHVEKVVS